MEVVFVWSLVSLGPRGLSIIARCPYYRGSDCMKVDIFWTLRTFQYKRGIHRYDVFYVFKVWYIFATEMTPRSRALGVRIIARLVHKERFDCDTDPWLCPSDVLNSLSTDCCKRSLFKSSRTQTVKLAVWHSCTLHIYMYQVDLYWMAI